MERDLTDRQLERFGTVFPDVDGAVYQVTGRLARIGTYLERRQAAVFEQYGLGRGEVGMLSALRLVGPPHTLTPGKLGRGLLLSSAGVTSRVDRLERRGLVERHPDPDDRRGVLITLTEHGAELVDRAIRANTESEREVLTGFSAKDVEALERLLRRLTTSLEAGG
jgi:DNA-binding MarR family transcriptional regulator